MTYYPFTEFVGRHWQNTSPPILFVCWFPRHSKCWVFCCVWLAMLLRCSATTRKAARKAPSARKKGWPLLGGLAARYLKKWSWCFCDPPWLAQSIIYLYIHAYMYKCIYIYICIHHESYPSGCSSIEQKKILGGRRAQVSASKVNAATHEMWEAVGLRNSSPRINQLFAELMRGPLLVNDRHPYQGLNLLQRMGQLPALGQIFLPQNQYFLAAEHAEFVRAAFEEGSQTFDPSPVRTVARTMVALLARAAGGIGKLRALVRAQDVEGRSCFLLSLLSILGCGGGGWALVAFLAPCAQRVVSRGTAPSSSRSKRRARRPVEISMHSPVPYQGCMRTRFGLGKCWSLVLPELFLYPFTSSHCGIFSSCDNVPMMLRRVFGDFDVRAIRELLVPGQGVAIRAGAPRRLKFFIRFTQRTAQICRCEWQGKEISPPITRVISHWIELRWRLRRDAGHCAATTDERERPRSAVVEGVSVRLLLSVEIAEQDCFWSSIDSFACSITIELLSDMPYCEHIYISPARFSNVFLARISTFRPFAAMILQWFLADTVEGSPGLDFVFQCFFVQTDPA